MTETAIDQLGGLIDGSKAAAAKAAASAPESLPEFAEIYDALAGADWELDQGMTRADTAWRNENNDPVDSEIEKLVQLKTKATQRAKLLGEAQTAHDDRLAAAENKHRELVDVVESMMTPQRPAGDVAAQEAQLANLRTDLKMRLNALPVDDVPAALAEMLSRALGTADQLTAWFLAGPWAEQYLKTRPDSGVAGARWADLTRGEVLTAHAAPRALAACRALKVLEGPTGLVAGITARRHAARMRIEDATGR